MQYQNTKPITITLALVAFLVVLATVLDKIADLYQRHLAQQRQTEIENAGYRALQPIMKMLDILLKNTAHSRDINADRFLFLPELITTLSLGLISDKLARASYLPIHRKSGNTYNASEIYSAGYMERSVSGIEIKEGSLLYQTIEAGDTSAQVQETKYFSHELGAEGNFSESLAVPVQSKDTTHAILLLETSNPGELTETDRLALIVLARTTALLLETSSSDG